MKNRKNRSSCPSSISKCLNKPAVSYLGIRSQELNPNLLHEWQRSSFLRFNPESILAGNWSREWSQSSNQAFPMGPWDISVPEGSLTTSTNTCPLFLKNFLYISHN